MGTATRIVHHLSVIMFASAMLSSAQFPAGAKTSGFYRHLPKPGDRFSVEAVSVAVPSDSALWDFSGIQYLGKDKKLRFFAPSDTLFAVVSGSGQCTFRLANDTLWLISEETRLANEQCNVPLLTSANRAVPITQCSSVGIYCGRHDFNECGTIYGETQTNGTLILSDDTLKNVSLMHWHQIGDIHYVSVPDSLSMKHIKDVYLWYDQSHRYPILSTFISEYTSDGNVISNHSVSYLFSTDMQDIAFGKPEDAAKDYGGGNNADGKIIADAKLTTNGSAVNVEFSVKSDASIEFLLCDSFGRVYYAKRGGYSASEGLCTVSFDTTGLNPGGYVIHLKSAGEFETLKFVKGL